MAGIFLSQSYFEKCFNSLFINSPNETTFSDVFKYDFRSYSFNQSFLSSALFLNAIPQITHPTGSVPVEQETVDRSADAEPELYTRVQVAGKDTALDRVTTRTDA